MHTGACIYEPSVTNLTSLERRKKDSNKNSKELINPRRRWWLGPAEVNN